MEITCSTRSELKGRDLSYAHGKAKHCDQGYIGSQNSCIRHWRRRFHYFLFSVEEMGAYVIVV